jgi:hypothetical protein
MEKNKGGFCIYDTDKDEYFDVVHCEKCRVEFDSKNYPSMYTCDFNGLKRLAQKRQLKEDLIDDEFLIVQIHGTREVYHYKCSLQVMEEKEKKFEPRQDIILDGFVLVDNNAINESDLYRLDY